MIAALPAKGLALGRHQTRGIDATSREQAAMLVGKVLAYDADEARLGEETGGHREVGSGTAEDVVHGAAGRLDGIKCDGADNK